MIMGPSVTDLDLYVAVQAFLGAILPSSVQVIQGQQNRVAEPADPNYVVMQPPRRGRMGTNLTTYESSESGPVGIANIEMSTKMSMQLDVHGPSSGDYAQIIATLWYSPFAVRTVRSQGYDISPLYADDPVQLPFLNAEQQYETQYSFDVVMQANPIVSLPQDFATQLALGVGSPTRPPGATPGLIDVDVFYPPRPGSVGVINVRVNATGYSF